MPKNADGDAIGQIVEQSACDYEIERPAFGRARKSANHIRADQGQTIVDAGQVAGAEGQVFIFLFRIEPIDFKWRLPDGVEKSHL